MGRNVTMTVENETPPDMPEIFRDDGGRASSEGRLRYLQDNEYERAHLYVLSNAGILDDYER